VERVGLIYIKEVEGKGRGVFCKERLVTNQCIEISPIILIPASDVTKIKETMLNEYIFGWNDLAFIGLGNVSLYNHSDEPNAEAIPVIAEKSVIINAIQEIEPNTEICIKYPQRQDSWF